MAAAEAHGEVAELRLELREAVAQFVLDSPDELTNYELPEPPRGGLREAPAVAAFDRLMARDRSRTSSWDYWRHVRRRYLDGGIDALSDHEVLEVLLSFSSPRLERRAELARSLIRRFGSVAGVMCASPRALAEFPSDSRRATYLAVCLLKAVQVASVRIARAEVVDRPLMSSTQAVLSYCQARMARLREEALRILYLNRKNMLIHDEELQRGTIDHVPLYPREVLRRALEVGAAAVVMVHNHPSGDPSPSTADIEMTQQVVGALALLDIAVHDHIIIGLGSHVSMRGRRLM